MVCFLLPLLTGGMALAGLLTNRRSKAEKKRMAEQEAAMGEMRTTGRKAQADFSAAGAKMDRAARGVRGGFSAPMDYYRALLGGDRSKMMSATAPARASMLETYAGGKRSLGRSRMRGAAKDQAEAEMDRQNTGQLAGLVQGIQPMAASQLGSMEAQVQQLMQAYSGLGLNAKAQGYDVLARMLGQAGSMGQGLLDNESQYRESRSNSLMQFGQSMAPMIGASIDSMKRPTGPVMNNQMGRVAPTMPGWRIPRTEMGGLPSRGVGFGNAAVNTGFAGGKRYGVPTYGTMVDPRRGF